MDLDNTINSIVIDADKVATFPEDVIETAIQGAFAYEGTLPVRIEWSDPAAKELIETFVDENRTVEWVQKDPDQNVWDYLDGPPQEPTSQP